MTDDTNEKSGMETKLTAISEPSDSELERFGKRTKTEVVGILEAIVKANEFVSVYCSDQQDFLLTTLLAVNPDTEKLYLDFGANQIMNRRVVEEPSITCVTLLDKIKVQFELRGLQTTEFARKPAFVAAIPKLLLRFQRRDYYRLQVPTTLAVRVVFMAKQPGGQSIRVDARLNDISIGGLKLSVPVATCDPAIGTEYRDCRIELPDLGTITASMVVRSREDRTLRNGSVARRLGCEFLGLSNAAETLIQRFIFVTDRGQTARKQSLRR